MNLKVGDEVIDSDFNVKGVVHSIESGAAIIVNFGHGYFRYYCKNSVEDRLVSVNTYIRKINEKYEVDCQGDDKYKIEEYDNVNKPKHYMLFPEHNIEVRDLMKLLADQLDYEGYSAMLISDYIQAMQYLLRWHNKNGAEDVRKAKWYLDKVIEELDNGDSL